MYSRSMVQMNTQNTHSNINRNKLPHIITATMKTNYDSNDADAEADDAVMFGNLENTHYADDLTI